MNGNGTHRPLRPSSPRYASLPTTAPPVAPAGPWARRPSAVPSASASTGWLADLAAGRLRTPEQFFAGRPPLPGNRPAPAAGQPYERRRAERRRDCPPVPLTPPGVSLRDNMKTARDRFLYDPLYLQWFKNQVDYGKPWDYKRLDPINNQYEDFGNFHYGATGASAFIPDYTLRRAAGWAQRKNKTTKQFGGDPGTLPGIFLNPFGGTYPYGDDPRDQYMIDQGIRYAGNGCDEEFP